MNTLVVSKLRRAASPSNLGGFQDFSLRQIIDLTTGRRSDSFKAPDLNGLSLQKSAASSRNKTNTDHVSKLNNYYN